MSLAYIASSLDATGMLAFISLKMTYASKGNGRTLFLVYFLLTCAITTVTSNDVTIMVRAGCQHRWQQQLLTLQRTPSPMMACIISWRGRRAARSQAA